jgi:hypothetical protein
MTIFLPENMLNLEVIKPRYAAASFLVEGPKFRAVDPILSLHLFDHEFRVRDDSQAPVPVVDGKFQGGEKRRIFGKVVGPGAQVFAQLGKHPSGRILDVYAEAGWPRIAAGSSVAVGDNCVGNRGTKAAIGSMRGRGHRLRLT